MSLATYSQELKVFSIEDEYSSPVTASITTVNPTHGRITWSGDGKWLAVAPVDRVRGPLPIFKYSNKQLQPMRYITLTNVASASFFNWTNRNIAVGNESGEIFVWDIKDKKIATKVEYTENHSVDLIAVNSEDNYIASASLTTNKICLHGLKTNKVINTFCLPKSGQTSSLKFCLCKKNYLAASSLESTICVWDIMRSDYVFKKLKAHEGACTDISFSPINFGVIASVSLTKTLKMFDIRECKSVLSVNIGEPMNSVDIILNGDKVALGTTGGSVIIYDLRVSKVLQAFKAHSGPVLCVKTQNIKIAKSYTEVEMSTPDAVENPSKTLDLSVMDIFSPIMRSNPKKDVSNCLLSQSKTLPVHSTPNLALNTTTESPSIYDDSFLKKVLSPLPQHKSTHSLSHTGHASPNAIAYNETPSNNANNNNNNYSSSILFPIIEKPDSAEQIDCNLNVPVKTMVEPPEINSPNVNVNGGCGDGFHSTNSENRNLYYNDIVSEIRSCQNSILNEINSVRQEMKEMRNDFDKKFKLLKENCDSLRILVKDDVQQEIYTANCNSKIENSCQRILLNELNESVLASEEKITNEIKLNALRLMHIYEVIKKAK
ncbi:hypothetical protein RUM43_013495 [Polyplax serrata]|uniref:Protein NEDD1 n=1 Tax=Polyplax serrata TaxID=468196 RepID=A0AAN8Q2V0_POLSC